jgi:hypothetical protein
MENFCFHRIDCCLMKDSVPIDLIVVLRKISVPIDLIVVLWRIFAPIDLIVVLWKNFCSHRLDCCLMEDLSELTRFYGMFPQT